MKGLYNDLMSLCASNESFYFVDHNYNGVTFRVFSYRLSTYSDFLLPGALECRGHTFRLDPSNVETTPTLISIPMEKFFNVGENPMTMNLDWSKVVRVDDKRDGSLISTVSVGDGDDGEFILKSKTSLISQQAKLATDLLGTPEYEPLWEACRRMTKLGFTVNMEYTAPTNQIVLTYKGTELRVLNIRSLDDGSYLPLSDLDIPTKFLVDTFVDKVSQSWVDDARTKTGVEGWVLWFDSGMKVKLKTDWYSNLHLQKERVASSRSLFELVLMEQSDDLKTLFLKDPQSIARIEEMEVKAKTIYNRLHKLVDDFYQTNKDLSRKDYAVLAQKLLKSEGVFPQAMNLYSGKAMGLREHLIKNFKSLGLVEVEDTSAAIE
ncbi:hypothetical protein EYR41_001894 [Orbilia oligospora]|uniref:Uncharacterized protein n=1 Tax=Orbilia oligospora TaxID=2813651 RepID=A0A7C8PJ03_ORBOL|nr:hypothetical protein TWF751_006896 [Orbilia oligospora]TGJ74938.1 hypothetical protein EYR41_001894 [Orbilia oligospora]